MIERTLDVIWMIERLREMGATTEDETALLREVGRNVNWFVKAKHGGTQGLFWFRDLGNRRWQVHACVAKKHWSRKWVALSRAVCRWFWGQSKARELQTFCPDTAPESAVYARLCGMRRMGRGEFAGETGTFMVLRNN